MKTSWLSASSGVVVASFTQRTLHRPLPTLKTKTTTKTASSATASTITSRPFHTSRPLHVSPFTVRARRIAKRLATETRPSKIRELEAKQKLLDREMDLKSVVQPEAHLHAMGPRPSLKGLNAFQRLDVHIQRETDPRKKRQLQLRKIRLQMRRELNPPPQPAPGTEGLSRIERLAVQAAQETNPARARMLEEKRQRLMAEKDALARREAGVAQLFTGTPTWSVRALLPPSSSGSTDEEPAIITPETLHHLLRLSALPPPASTTEEAAMLAILHTQLHFVRDIQTVATKGVQPLHVIRDERSDTLDRMLEARKTLLNKAIAQETRFGFHGRPRRNRVAEAVTVKSWSKLDVNSKAAKPEPALRYPDEEALVELATRPRRKQGFFVVDGGKTKRGE